MSLDKKILMGAVLLIGFILWGRACVDSNRLEDQIRQRYQIESVES